MKKAALIITFLPVFLLFSCDRVFSPFQSPTTRPFTQMEKKIAESTADFSMKIFSGITSVPSDSNIFISPISISYALAMAANGAEGTTREEILNTLGFGNMAIDDVNKSFHSLMSLLVNTDPDVILTIANSIWYKKGFPVEQSFLKINKSYYSAEVNELDFSSPDAVKTINTWVYDNTNGKIEKILDSIDPASVMFLLNAIYFKGMWQYKFDENFTIEDVFTTSSGDTVHCKMMTITENLPCFETDTFEAVDIPYGSGNFAMAVLVPKSGNTAENIIKSMNKSSWDMWQQKFKVSKQTITLQMPKFETRYKIKLNDVLKNLGIKKAFSPSDADFSGICKSYDLYIDEILHKSFIKIDEKGTEAAAVTIIDYKMGISNSTDNVKFIKVDRPFIFIIHEKTNGTILFEGKINNPVI
ncbi:serpin family protein [bacterium]|nr:serpin family protein [bacterium]